MIILGIDPGSRVTGFGLIEHQGGERYRYITSGCIRTQGPEPAARLLEIYQGLTQITTQHQPEHMAVEQCFLSRNPNTAIKLGQARGIALLVGQQHHMDVHEYAPRRVKQAIVGYGHADKSQMQHMVKTLLNLTQPPSSDAADALAMALCHSHHWQTLRYREQVS